MRYLLFIILVLTGISCSKENPGLIHFQIVSPHNNDTLAVGDTLVIEAGYVSSNTAEIFFYVDSVLAAEIKAPPYIYKREVRENDIGLHTIGFEGYEEDHNSSFGLGVQYHVVEKK